METRLFDLKTQYEEGLNEAAAVIREGGLVVFPTETVYGIGADAMAPRAVAEIFRVKGRPQDNPLIVHIARMEQVGSLAREVSPLARRLMEAFWPGPFTAVLPCRAEVPRCVTGGLDTVGIRMPAAPAARELIARSGRLIAAPSANISGRPSPTRSAHVVEDFFGKVPVILDGGEAAVGVESTVCDLTGEVPTILRPGGVTAEMLRAAAGDVRISGAVLGGLGEGEKAASPGMKYKHYSPRARVLVIDGASREAVARRMAMLYNEEEENGRHARVLCLAPVPKELTGRDVQALGANAGEAARALFEALRAADRDGVDTVLFEAVRPEGMGLAVMNRIIRAAGFTVISADEEP